MKKKKKSNKFYKTLSFILVLITVFALSVITYFEAIPSKYLIILGIILAIIIILIVYKLNVKTTIEVTDIKLCVETSNLIKKSQLCK